MRSISKGAAAVILAVTLLFPAIGWAASQGEREGLLDGALVYNHGFSGEYNIKKMGQAVQEYFQIGNWDVRDINLHLEYDITPLGRADFSAEVYLNNAFVGSYRLEKSSSRQSLDISLPAENLHLESGNALSIHIIAQDEAENCVDSLSAATKWVNFFEESHIRVDYLPMGECRSIGEFYKGVTSIEAMDNYLSAICLPKSPSARELTVGANAAAALSGNAAVLYENLLLTMGYDNLPEAARYVLYIGEYDNVEPQIKAALSQSQVETAENGALMALIEVDGRHVLVVTGGGEAFLSGAKALSNRPLMEKTNAEWRALSPQEDYLSPKYTVEQYVQLTEEGEYVQGNFEQSISFYIDYPANRRIAKSSELSLDFEYSDELDFERSLLTVFINDLPAGSKKLAKERASGDSLELSFPEDLDITGAFHIRLSFQLDPGDDWCHLQPSQLPWARVRQSSMAKIASSDLLYPDFGNFPSPFLRDGAMNNVVILLPKDPTGEDLQAMHAVSLSLGRFMKENHGDLRVDFFESAEDLSGANIIAIGAGEQNAILQEQKKLLPLMFTEGGYLVEERQRGAIQRGYGDGLGAAQLALSPYSDQVNALLVISGAGPEEVLRAAKIIGSQEGLWRLSGDAFIAYADGEVRAFLFESDRGDYQMPVSKRLEEAKGSAMTAMLALAGTLLLAALGAALIFARHRGEKNE
jgi:hypothetical protein